MVRVWFCHTQFGWIAAWSFTTRPHSLQPQPQPYFDLWFSLEAAGMARGCYGTMERPKKHLGFWVQDSTFLPHKIQLQGFCSQNLPDPRHKNCPKIFGALSHPEFLSCVASCQIQHNKHSQFSHWHCSAACFVTPQTVPARARRATPSRGSTLG